MSGKLKIAGVQMDIEFAKPSVNLERMKSKLKETTGNGAWLTVFPECTTTGYCFESLDEAKTQAESLGGETQQAVIEMCAELETRVVFGFIENSMKGSTFRGIGMDRAKTNVTLTNLLYNIFRFEQIKRLGLKSWA